MSPTGRKIAIILHGPPAAGKSTIRDIIYRRQPAGTARVITLDSYWSPGEERYARGPQRYLDVAQSLEATLILELACGVPSDLSSPGSAADAPDWIEILKRSGREVFPFLLWADWDETVRRLLARHEGNPHVFWETLKPLGLYALYEHRHPFVTFPVMEGFNEVRIITSRRPLKEVVDEILSKCRL